MVFYVGRLRPFRWSEVKHVSGWDDMCHASNGDVFDVLDHVFEWDDDCVSQDLCSRCGLLVILSLIDSTD